jgi:hypothetical protein
VGKTHIQHTNIVGSPRLSMVSLALYTWFPVKSKELLRSDFTASGSLPSHSDDEEYLMIDDKTPLPLLLHGAPWVLLARFLPSSVRPEVNTRNSDSVWFDNVAGY